MKKFLTKLFMLLGVFVFLGAGNAHSAVFKWYLVGDFNNWGSNTTYKCEQEYNSAGTFTWNLSQMTSGNFKFRRDDNGWYNYSGNSGKYRLSSALSNEGVTITQSNSDDNAWLNKTIYDVTIKVVLTGGGDNVYLDYLEISGSSKPKTYTYKWYLLGDFNDWGANNTYKCEQEYNSAGTFSWKLSKMTPGNFKFRRNDGDWYQYSDNADKYQLSQELKNAGVSITQSSSDNNAWLNKEITNVTITVTLAGSGDNVYCDKIVISGSASRPEAMYLYGHVNNGYWDPKNYVELTYDPDTKKYVNEYVEIGGFWSAKDVSMGTGRKLYDPAEPNYLCLHDNTNLTLESFNKGTGTWKYGSDSGQNNRDFFDNANRNCDVDKSPIVNKTAKLVYQEENETNNFSIKTGFYKVTVDLENNTIQFEEVAEYKPRDYVWFLGDDANKDKIDATLIEDTTDEGHAYHCFTYGDNDIDVVQVGIGTNPLHKAARQAVYTVWYRPLQAKSNIKRKADAIDDMPSIDDTYAEGVEDQHYKIIGSDGYNDNTLVQLLKAGDYVITANVKDDPQDLEGYEIKPATLFVTVDAATVSPNIGTTTTGQEDSTSSIAQAFSTSGTNTFPGLLSFTATGEITTSDFTITLTPKDNASGWATTTATDQELDDVYAEALIYEGSTLPKQYENLKASYVDGFYRAGKSTAKAVAKGDNTFDIQLQVPCSGLYVMKISNNDANGSSTIVGEKSVVVKIYPNLVGKFGTDMGFNIGGYTFTDQYIGNEQPTINLPTVFEDYNDITAAHAYTPGTYFASAFGPTSEAASAVADEELKNGSNYSNVNNSNYFAYVDLTPVKSSAMLLPMTITKNGAVANYKFDINFSNTGNNWATGVDTIGAEAGEAVYFNLQGVRVENPEHGIFVKVVDGKAQKVVL